MIKNSLCSIFTLVKDDAINLPIWLKYYSRYFGKENIHVFDHESTDGSTDNIEHICTKEVVNYPYVSEKWKFDFVRKKQRELLKKYKYAIFTDCDEFIIPDPEKYKDLEDFILRAKEKTYRCRGYNVIHLKEKESAIDLTRPILLQRRFWYLNPHSCKVLLAKVPIDWEIGFHKVEGKERPINNDLILIHLHRMDFDLFIKRHLHWLTYKWAEEDLKRGWDWQYRLTNIKDLEDYFFGRIGEENKPVVLEEIPEKWKTII